MIKEIKVNTINITMLTCSLLNSPCLWWTTPVIFNIIIFIINNIKNTMMIKPTTRWSPAASRCSSATRPPVPWCAQYWRSAFSDGDLDVDDKYVNVTIMSLLLIKFQPSTYYQARTCIIIIDHNWAFIHGQCRLLTILWTASQYWSCHDTLLILYGQ